MTNSCATDTLSNNSNGNFYDDVNDMTSNFMDYSSCGSEFSAGQRDMMHFNLENSMAALFLENREDDVCKKPCDQEMEISFTYDHEYPISGDVINFNSHIDGADIYEWYVEYLGEYKPIYSIAMEMGYAPSTSPIANTQDLIHQFNQTEKFRVYLKAWNNSSPDCFTSYFQIVRVSCGVDARFWPDIRFQAAKQPEALFLEPVTFTNRSYGASTFQWTITHASLVTNGPTLPEFNSTDTTLIYTFPEPGVYEISLLAINDPCEDKSNSFLLTVVDPTIDGVPSILNADCYNNDSIRISLRMYNYGYDTINISTPVSFYDTDPQQSNPQPNLLKTYLLPKIVYGFDSADYTLYVRTNQPNLDQIYAVFNDKGNTTFPISFPTSDLNVLSNNSIPPPSGYAELSYDNNYAATMEFQFKAPLAADIWACIDSEIVLTADPIWKSVIWESTLRPSGGINKYHIYSGPS